MGKLKELKGTITMQKTDWFPGNVKPIRAGVYEARSPRADIVGAWYKHFDGEQWAMSRATPERAYDDRLSTPGAHQDWLWRGLSNDA